MFISFRNSLTGTPQIMLDQRSGHSMAQSNCKINQITIRGPEKSPTVCPEDEGRTYTGEY